MTTLSRSCSACIKSKRRCNLQLPQCFRCSERGLECCYVNEPLTALTSVVANTKSTRSRAHASPAHTAAQLPSFEEKAPIFMGPTAERRLCQEIGLLSISSVSSINLLQLPLPEGLRMVLDKPTIMSLMKQLRAFALTFVREQRTPFFHPHLYTDGVPKPIQDVYMVLLCRARSRKTRDNRELVFQILQSKVVELERATRGPTSFIDKLAFCQTLLLGYIMCAFDSGARLRALADVQMRLLIDLADELWRRAPSQISNDLNPWQAWLYAESVRRTIIISHLLRDFHSMLKYGYFTHTLFIEALPFDVRTSLWDVSSTHEWEGHGHGSHSSLISWRELTTMFEEGEKKEYRVLETLLLTACKGKGRVAMTALNAKL